MSRRTHHKHETTLFPSTISTQSPFAYFLTVKAVVRKFGKTHCLTRCFDKAVLAQRGGECCRAQIKLKIPFFLPMNGTVT